MTLILAALALTISAFSAVYLLTRPEDPRLDDVDKLRQQLATVDGHFGTRLTRLEAAKPPPAEPASAKTIAELVRAVKAQGDRIAELEDALGYRAARIDHDALKDGHAALKERVAALEAAATAKYRPDPGSNGASATAALLRQVRSRQAIVAAVEAYDDSRPLIAARLREATGCSFATLRARLNELVGAGVLKVVGRHRSVRNVYARTEAEYSEPLVFSPGRRA